MPLFQALSLLAVLPPPVLPPSPPAPLPTTLLTSTRVHCTQIQTQRQEKVVSSEETLPLIGQLEEVIIVAGPALDPTQARFRAIG